MTEGLLPGQMLARGVARHLRDRDFASVAEFVPTPGLRVDLMALGPRGEIWIIECKSGRADFTSDRKWQGYTPWCDRFFWAVDAAFPVEILPGDSGIMLADGFDAEISRLPEPVPLPAARRRALTLRLARTAAWRLQAGTDPAPAGRGGFD